MNTMENVTKDAQGTVLQKRRSPRREFDEDALVAQDLGSDDEARLKAERVQEMLRAMPEWQLVLEGRVINRVRAFPSADVAMSYCAFVAGFAKAHKLPVRLSLSGKRVMVALHAPAVRGRLGNITERVVTFARQLG